MRNTQISVFGERNGKTGAFQTLPTSTVDFKGLLQMFKSEQNRILSEAILNASSKEEKNKLKAKREYFTPYGKFSERNNASILHHNNLIAIDIDGLSSVEVAKQVRNKLATHPSTLLALLSTRGKGVKALMYANVTYTPQEQFEQLKYVFRPYLSDFLEINEDYIDKAQFKLSQPFYMCYDADMYINENAVALEI